MKLILEDGDFPVDSGKRVADLDDPMYAWRIEIIKRPDWAASARIYHKGGGYRVEAEKLSVEIAAKTEPTPAADEKPAKQSRGTRNAKGQFVKQEPALSGPRLPEGW